MPRLCASNREKDRGGGKENEERIWGEGEGGVALMSARCRDRVACGPLMRPNQTRTLLEPEHENRGEARRALYW